MLTNNHVVQGADEVTVTLGDSITAVCAYRLTEGVTPLSVGGTLTAVMLTEVVATLLVVTASVVDPITTPGSTESPSMPVPHLNIPEFDKGLGPSKKMEETIL